MHRGPYTNDITRLEGGGLPKGDVSPYAYLVKWVTRGRGQKSQKIGDINGWPPNKFLSIEFSTFTTVLSDIILSAENPKLKVP